MCPTMFPSKRMVFFPTFSTSLLPGRDVSCLRTSHRGRIIKIKTAPSPKTSPAHGALRIWRRMRTQTTCYDTAVHNTHEIPFSEFAVESALLDTVRKCSTAARFHPRAVRVDPYKIHLYGQDSHLKPHRDAPELGLIGTFLLGLGDSTYTKNLKVDGKNLLSTPWRMGRVLPRCRSPSSTDHLTRAIAL
ncbi:hypothetical protein OF83DRAFT_373379 [Amylostereum chailletii]|nr:hypothetical protein OF83DRAFT_373379 [Amylostereum chailletii]